MSNLTKAQGEVLLKTARSAIEADLSKKPFTKPKSGHEVFKEPHGVFVTLNTKLGELRGCIGYPEPVEPLMDAVIKSAISAATQDPRFPPVKLAELNDLVIEITVLTVPQKMEVKHTSHYALHIVLGRDGLIVEQGNKKGLLLPQVPLEWGWNEKQFLEHTCEKTGLPKDAWKDMEKTKVYKFQGQIFKE